MVFSIEVICFILASLLFLYYYLNRTFDYWKIRGVKGPNPTIIFGTIKDVIFTKISLSIYLKNLYNKYKDDQMFGIFEKDIPSLVLCNPDLIKDVIIKDFSIFPERPVFCNEKCEPMTGHLFRIGAAKWRPLRTKLTQVFTSGKLKNMFHLLLECGEHFEKHLKCIVKKNEPIECRDLMARYTTDVIGSCAFGLNINAINDDNNEFRQMGKRIFRNDLKTYVKELVRNTPWLYNIIGRLLVDIDVEKFFIRITTEMIDYRKRNNIRRHDFMDVLTNLKDLQRLGDLELTDGILAAQAIVFFAAGFETSSATLCNAMYELAMNHTIQTKLRKEIKEVLESNDGKITYDCLKEMKYLHAVIEETLRIYPPVMYLVRGSLKDYTFNGTNVTISKGTKVFIPIYGIQHDPDIYPDPEVFDPDRFTDEVTKSRHPMHFLPFGDGPRNCIGLRFAYLQMKIGLITVLNNYVIDVCEKTPMRPYPLNMQDAMMLQPTCGIYVKLSPITAS
ncbi:PREDICTED: probable cytochrome P450 6a13 [Polistes canadensis]|uniref:probable cytochrome P450 6a13 n=1 Tax=Polistes canadensis TaxID=91411 RepID=UPI000718D445|nr:PREDICTED: probable cytochrome P450 6a13 [Polistes canadensis]